MAMSIAGARLEKLDGAHRVQRFVEKPDAATAKAYIADGGYFWNSGMFVFRADVLLEELRVHAPDVLAAARDALAKAKRDTRFRAPRRRRLRRTRRTSPSTTR